MIYTATLFKFQDYPGSMPIVSTFNFSTQEKRSAFIDDWILENDIAKFVRDAEELKFYAPGNWITWIELNELKLDCTYINDRILKQY